MSGLPVFVATMERRDPPDSSTLALATVRIGPITVHHVALLRLGATGFAVGMPRRFHADIGWRAIVELDDAIGSEVRAALTAAYADGAS